MEATASTKVTRVLSGEPSHYDDDGDAGRRTWDDIDVDSDGIPTEPVGRYTIEDKLGAGGMGEVFGAVDPTLQRTVALKLVRPRREDAAQAGARLRREAQALARLSHPNVVPVFDAGVHGDRIFIAMERVDGQTLSEWNEERSPDWLQVLEMLVQAGRGLAAAHRAGVIHRDFKPGNVMVGADGRARVLDFGLARDIAVEPSQSIETPGLDASLSGDSASFGSDSLTEVGMVMGTPSYMAPEQFLGEGIDARCDQFAFCVSVYRLLYDQAPFDGRGFRALRQSVLHGHPRVPLRSTRVPKAIWAVLERGMSTEPDRRYADMDQLLDALERAATPRRRLAFMSVGGLALVLGGLGVAEVGGRGGDPCEAVQTRVEASWGDERRDAVQASFEAVDRPYAKAAWAEVDQRLTDYMGRWGEARQQACQSVVRSTRGTSADLDRRIVCLERQLSRADALIETLETTEPDPEVVENAPQALLRLPVLAECMRGEDGSRSGSSESIDLDPRTAAEVAALERQLDALAAKMLVRHDVSVLAEAQQIGQQAEALGVRPLIAEAQRTLGRAHRRDGEFAEARAAYEAAIQASAEAGDVRGEVVGQLLLVAVLSSRLAEHEAALRQLRATEALLVRLDDPPVLRARLEEARGHTHLEAGNLDAAEVLLRRVLDQPAEHEGMESVLASARSALGITLSRQGRYADSVVLLGEEIEILERLLGPDHPRLAKSLGNQGSSLSQLGRLDEAEVALTRAVEIYTRASGPRAHGLENPLHNLGVLHYKRGRKEQGIETLTRAAELMRDNRGPDHPSLGWLTNDLGTLLFMEGDPVAALPHLREAARIFELSQGDKAPGLVYTMSAIIQAYLRTERPDEAMPYVERSLELLERQTIDPAGAGALRYAAARALWHSGQRERAMALAEQAKVDMEGSERSIDEQIAAVVEWIEMQRAVLDASA